MSWFRALCPRGGLFTAVRMRPTMVRACPMKAFTNRFSGVSVVGLILRCGPTFGRPRRTEEPHARVAGRIHLGELPGQPFQPEKPVEAVRPGC